MINYFVYSISRRQHHWFLKIFLLIVTLHLAEHIIQVFQLWSLGWERKNCLGLLGLWQPWLMRSEWLHYGHAVFMLIGLAILRPRIEGKARFWWDVALVLQFYHHFEHALLLGQALTGQNLFNSPIPLSIGQMWIPRIELHLFYNLMVLVPMIVGMVKRKKQHLYS